MARSANPVNWTALSLGTLAALGLAGGAVYFATRKSKVPDVAPRDATQQEIDSVQGELPAPPPAPVLPAEAGSASAPKPKVAQETQGTLSGVQLRAEWIDPGFFTDDVLPLVNGGGFFAKFDDKAYSVATDGVDPRDFFSFRARRDASRNGYSFELTALGKRNPVIKLETLPSVPDVFVDANGAPRLTLLDRSINAFTPNQLFAEFEAFAAGDTSPAARLRLYFVKKGSA